MERFAEVIVHHRMRHDRRLGPCDDDKIPAVDPFGELPETFPNPPFSFVPHYRIAHLFGSDYSKTARAVVFGRRSDDDEIGGNGLLALGHDPLKLGAFEQAAAFGEPVVRFLGLGLGLCGQSSVSGLRMRGGGAVLGYLHFYFPLQMTLGKVGREAVRSNAISCRR